MPFVRVPEEAEAFARGPDGLEDEATAVSLGERIDEVEADLAVTDSDARKWFPVPLGADDAPELISRLGAGEKDIALRRGTYLWNQALGTIPADAAIMGAGKRLTKIEKGFSGTLATLADGVQLADLKIDGKGAARTGKAFLFTGADGRQSFRQVEIVDMDDVVLDFATAAGSQSEFVGCKFARYNGIARDVYAVQVDAAQQLAAVPRKFLGVETDGTPFADLGGCNGFFVGVGGYLGKLLFNAESRGVNIAAERFGGDYASTSPAGTATTVNGSPTITSVTQTTGGGVAWLNGMHITGPGIPADTIIVAGAGTATMVLSRNCTASASGIAIASSVLYVRGFNHSMSGDFGAQVVIPGNYSAITIDATHNNPPVIDQSAFAYTNLIQSSLVPYTPILSSDGIAPDLGNGTCVGFWSRTGERINFEIRLVRGTTTTFGTGQIRFSLPHTPTGGTDQTVEGMLLDVSVAGNMHYLLGGVIVPGTAYVSLRANALAFGVGEANFPPGLGWAGVGTGVGDIIRISGSYGA